MLGVVEAAAKTHRRRSRKRSAVATALASTRTVTSTARAGSARACSAARAPEVSASAAAKTVVRVSEHAPLSAAQERTWLLLVGVMMWLPAELDAHLEQVVGLSHAEYGVLRCLSAVEDREIHMSRLAATASVTPSHLSRITARLQKRGLLTRSTDPGDARRTLARLTEQGAALVESTEPQYAALVHRCVFAHLDREQETVLEDVAEALLLPLRADCVQLLAPRRVAR